MKRAGYVLVALLLLVAAVAIHRRQPAINRATFFTFDSVVNLQGVCPPGEWDALVTRTRAMLAAIDRDLARDGGGFTARANALPRAAVPVPVELRDALRFADELHRASGGAFDPTILPLLDAYGLWGESFPLRPPASAAVRALLPRIGWSRHAMLTDSTLQVAAGSMVFFGALAEGYALERVAELWRGGG
ncbi:MAG TPA: FAD:protein FMN transferase, partial [bacterium]|nr:FAD:protein FMN transferase [bacterium]